MRELGGYTTVARDSTSSKILCWAPMGEGIEEHGALKAQRPRCSVSSLMSRTGVSISGPRGFFVQEGVPGAFSGKCTVSTLAQNTSLWPAHNRAKTP
jgi:hypothetical protein